MSKGQNIYILHLYSDKTNYVFVLKLAAPNIILCLTGVKFHFYANAFFAIFHIPVREYLNKKCSRQNIN